MATNWIGAITNSGNTMLNGWVGGKVLNFDGAEGGTGTVQEIAIIAQTALVGKKQDLSILGAERVAEGYRLKLRVPPSDEGYTLNQISIKATITGGQSTMLALFQHAQGIVIPSKTEIPDFQYTFYALVACSNTGHWTVTLDPTVFITRGEFAAVMEGVVRARIVGTVKDRDPNRPTYGMDESKPNEDVILLTGPYTGKHQAAVELSGELYDALNITPSGAPASDGDLILS